LNSDAQPELGPSQVVLPAVDLVRQRSETSFSVNVDLSLKRGAGTRGGWVVAHGREDVTEVNALTVIFNQKRSIRQP